MSNKYWMDEKLHDKAIDGLRPMVTGFLKIRDLTTGKTLLARRDEVISLDSLKEGRDAANR